MDSLVSPSPTTDTRGLAQDDVGSQALLRMLTASDQSSLAMLIADDERRCVTGNGAAAHLLGIPQHEIAFHTIDDFTPPSERAELRRQWTAFLANGTAEGVFALDIPRRGLVSAEFSATAHMMPARHLWIFVAPDHALGELEPTRYASPLSDRLRLTEREREIMTLVAAGGHSADIAKVLFVSADTVKTHVANSLGKLGAHTRAHAVSRALLTGQIRLGDIAAPGTRLRSVANAA